MGEGRFILRSIVILVLSLFSFVVCDDFTPHEDSCFQKSCFKVARVCNLDNKTFTSNDNAFGKTFFSFRPQDSNSASKILTLLDQRKSFNLTLTYQSSFNEGKQASWFMFNGSSCMTVGIPGDSAKEDVNGSQLGLSLGNMDAVLTPGKIGEICVKPKVNNYIFNLDYNFNLDAVVCGLWGRVALPIVRAETDLRVCATGNGIATDKFSKGLFSLECKETDVPYTRIDDAFEGDKGFGEIPPLNYSKFAQRKLIKTGLAGIHLNLGYDICRDWRTYVGLGLNVVVPTGNRPTGEYLFEPVVGANHCWQLGGLLECYKNWYCNDTKTGVYFYGTVNHLFKARQTRTFALKKNGAGSQFLLLKKFNPTVTGLDGADRVANILSGEAKIGAAVMVDASVMLQIAYRKLFFNLGYNLWFRTKEKTNDSICFSGFQDNRFGIKGNLNLSQIGDSCPYPNDPPCNALLSTASKSTIGVPADEDPSESNGDPIPKLLSCKNDIDVSAPLHPSAISNKIFATLGVNLYNESCNYNEFYNKAYILLSVEVEFGRNSSSISQWSIVSKVGIEF